MMIHPSRSGEKIDCTAFEIQLSTPENSSTDEKIFIHRQKYFYPQTKIFSSADEIEKILQ